MDEQPTSHRQDHWDEVYRSRGPADVSWYQREPTVSLELIAAAGVPETSAAVDIGGGASPLTGALVARGFTDLSVLDVSAAALDLARNRLGDRAGAVTWLHRDVLHWEPERRYELWHDRAVFHFLTDPADRGRYREVLHRALRPGAVVVVGTFASDGPEQCSGLPVCRYRASELAAELTASASGWVQLDRRTEDHVTPAGAVQPFTWVALRAPEG